MRLLILKAAVEVDMNLESICDLKMRPLWLQNKGNWIHSKAAKCRLKTLFLILERRKEERKMQEKGERRQNGILMMKETSKNLNREQVRVRLAAWGWPGSEYRRFC